MAERHENELLLDWIGLAQRFGWSWLKLAAVLSSSGFERMVGVISGTPHTIVTLRRCFPSSCENVKGDILKEKNVEIVIYSIIEVDEDYFTDEDWDSNEGKGTPPPNVTISSYRTWPK